MTGRGQRRMLRFRMRRLAGQRVRFLEDGSDTTHPIGHTTRSRGAIPFAAQEGRGRRRAIVAVIEQDGVPRRRLIVTRYTAPRPIRPGRPGRVRLRRRGPAASVTWARARRSTGHAIAIRGSDGRRELRLTSARRRRLTIDRVLPFERLEVSVRGEYGPAHRTGPARRGALNPKRRRARR